VKIKERFCSLSRGCLMTAGPLYVHCTIAVHCHVVAVYAVQSCIANWQHISETRPSYFIIPTLEVERLVMLRARAMFNTRYVLIVGKWHSLAEPKRHTCSSNVTVPVYTCIGLQQQPGPGCANCANLDWCGSISWFNIAQTRMHYACHLRTRAGEREGQRGGRGRAEHYWASPNFVAWGLCIASVNQALI